MKKRAKICLVPRLSGIGGMVSFQKKFAEGLKNREIEVCFDLQESNIDAILIIGGTRQMHHLWRAKRIGIPLVQRLDGMNWVHKVIDTGFRHRMRAEYGNFILSTIRYRFADKIAYQSEFSRKWWEREKGSTARQFRVIHNAVDLEEFSPGDYQDLAEGPLRILLVEGSLLGGYEFGLENAIKLSAELAHSQCGGQGIELIVVGKVPPRAKENWDNWLRDKGFSDGLSINWAGTVQHDQIKVFYRSAHVFFSADINAACPNSVIESMACGTPVIAYDTGALSELIGSDAGITVPYGGNPWQLDVPDVPALSSGVIEIVNNLEGYRKMARARAEAVFNLENMVDAYLELLLG